MRKLIFFATIALTAIHSHAQVTETLLERQRTERPQEKIYVQFDKAAWYAGETIWFKAHIFSGFAPSRISTVLYTELLDTSGKLLLRHIYPIVQSSAAGSMEIPAQTASQPLVFRAYTRWMLNFDEGFVFSRQLAVMGSDAAASVKKMAVANTVSLQVFPEGGDPVNGLESRVAFEAAGNDGKPATVEGKVLDDQDRMVATFSTRHDGMGSFRVKPEAARSYRLEARDAAGRNIRAYLPEARPSGVVMQFEAGAGGGVVHIARSAQNAARYDTLQLLVMLQQELLIGRVLIFKPGVLTLSEPLALEELPASVATITILSKSGEPLAERIFFTYNDNYRFPASLRITETSLAKRGKTRIEITVPENLSSNLSVSVVDGRYAQATSHHSIYSGLLLSGDIRGAIYNPAQYFNQPYAVVADGLDLVMLTHGWRRYNWRQMLMDEEPPLTYRPDSLITIGGIINVDGRRDTAGLTGLYLAYRNPDGSMDNIMLPPVAAGKFHNPGVAFFDSLNVTPFPLYKKKTRKRPDIELQTDLLPPVQIAPAAAAVTDSMPVQLLLEIARNDQRFAGSALFKPLEQVTVKAKAKNKQDELDEKYAGGSFSGGADRIIDLTDLSKLNVGDFWRYVMQEAPVGVSVNAQDTVEWRGNTTSLFLNEMQVDLPELQALSASEVAYVKFFKPPFLGAFGSGSGGAIAVYTRSGREGDWRNTNANRKFMLKGFTRMKEFYTPRYGPGVPVVNTDTRTTLYWNPYVFTSKKNQTAAIEFYNNDFSTSLFVVVEGVLANGRLVRMEKQIQ